MKGNWKKWIFSLQFKRGALMKNFTFLQENRFLHMLPLGVTCSRWRIYWTIKNLQGVCLFWLCFIDFYLTIIYWERRSRCSNRRWQGNSGGLSTKAANVEIAEYLSRLKQAEMGTKTCGNLSEFWLQEHFFKRKEYVDYSALHNNIQKPENFEPFLLLSSDPSYLGAWMGKASLNNKLNYLSIIIPI